MFFTHLVPSGGHPFTGSLPPFAFGWVPVLFDTSASIVSMDEIPVPFLTTPSDVLEVGEGHDVLRLEEIAEEIDAVRSDLYKPLMELVERGEVAIFPVGGSVQVRFDTDE